LKQTTDARPKPMRACSFAKRRFAFLAQIRIDYKITVLAPPIWRNASASWQECARQGFPNTTRRRRRRTVFEQFLRLSLSTILTDQTRNQFKRRSDQACSS
jgi:hypothetical protein